MEQSLGAPLAQVHQLYVLRGLGYYQGGRYPFSVGGLGVGGIGVSKIEAKGDVYGLQRLGDFAGAYAQGRLLTL